MTRIGNSISLVLLSAGIACAASIRVQPPPLGKLVELGGYRVHIYCTGQREPTVLVASGGFSFDWGLVQPKVAQLARICTYDPSGTAWSGKPGADKPPSCADRVSELHALVENAGVHGPYVMVGFSIGGLIARLYARRYPAEIAGMVLVDHAFLETGAEGAKNQFHRSDVDSPPVLISKTPIALDLEDDRNFSKLPERDQELHRWALSIHSERPTPEMAAECFSEVDAAEKTSFPLGTKPLIVISTTYDSPHYTQLQQQLLSLSHNSKQLVPQNSTHMVIIDRPDVVVTAIRQVVEAVRNNYMFHH